MAKFVIRNLAANAYWSLKDSSWSLTKRKADAKRFDNRWETKMFLNDQETEHQIERVSD